MSMHTCEQFTNAIMHCSRVTSYDHGNNSMLASTQTRMLCTCSQKCAHMRARMYPGMRPEIYAHTPAWLYIFSGASNGTNGSIYRSVAMLPYKNIRNAYTRSRFAFGILR